MAKEFSFEESLKRIEEINKKLDEENSTLDESLKLYEEGVVLASKCYSILKNAELKVNEINDGVIKKLSFEN